MPSAAASSPTVLSLAINYGDTNLRRKEDAEMTTEPHTPGLCTLTWVHVLYSTVINIERDIASEYVVNGISPLTDYLGSSFPGTLAAYPMASAYEPPR